MRSRWRKALLVLVAGLLLACIGAALFPHPVDEHPFFAQFPRRPLVIAHRGGKGLWPENTLYAFERAVAMGVDVLEMDIHSTAGGVLVVLHDETVDRTTDGSGPIQGMTLAELKTLDAGYRWSSDDGQTFPYRGQGIVVPTLEEVFAAFPALPMNIEIKQAEPALAVSLCRLIRDYDMSDRVLVASFHEQAIQALRDACPEVATTASQNQVVALFVLSKAFLDAIYRPNIQGVQVPEYRDNLHVLNQPFVDAVHGHHLEVHAWTINDADDMQRLLDLGVDGIITDYPDRLMDLLGR